MCDPESMKRQLALFLTLVLATAAVAQVSFDDATDFGAYRSYAWKEGTPARNMDMQDLIVKGVDRELQSKGLARVESKPDMYVTTYVLPDTVTADELAKNNSLEFWSGVTSVSPTDTGAGTLVVDLVDADSEKTVWRGVAAETIKGSFKKMANRVDAAIAKMFKRYPSP
jgi:hypothetical protein